MALLRPGGLGRIAVAAPSGPPEVMPVNYVLDGEAVVFRSDLGTKLTLLRGGAVRPMAAGPHRQWVRLEPTAISGRRIQLDEGPGSAGT